MIKIFFTYFLISLFPCFLFGQAQEEKTQYIRKGLLRAQGTISPGILLKENASTISLYGNLEYYIADNISLRGDSYYFLKSKESPFEFSHSTFSGASYHFKTKNNFDPYLAIEPGISITRGMSSICPLNADPNTICYAYKTTANPVVSSAFGFNFYFQRWFHLFGEVRYISGKYLSDAPPLSLNELRFSFGLGFNLNLLKKK